jgi:hypothetical protein
LLLLVFFLSHFLEFPIQAQAKDENKEPGKTQEPAKSKDETIPEEFRRMGKGLPPSKRARLYAWLWQLQYDTTYPRMRSARELYWYKDSEAIPYLVNALRDPYWGVRVSATEALAYLGIKKYTYITFSPPNFSKIKTMEEELVRKNLTLAEKGETLLKAETISINKHQIDIVNELKAAYYREVNFFKDEFVKQTIRKALEDLGSIDKIKQLGLDTYDENRKLNAGSQ